jgi:hypothetical protein
MCYDRNEVRQSRQISRKTPTKYTHSGLMERTRVALYALCKELNIKGMSKKDKSTMTSAIMAAT